MKSVLRWCLIIAAIFAAIPIQAVPRVALMDFSTDDNSYRSAQMAANFTGLLQIQLADEAGVEWVERAQLDKTRAELDLSTLEAANGATAIRRGKLAKANWMIAGQFSLNDRNQRTLALEITDLEHADRLAGTTITFSNSTAASFQVITNQINIAAAALHQLLVEAGLRQQQMAGKILVAPLFLAGASQFGFRRQENALEQYFNELLEHAAIIHSNVSLIHFPKAYRSTTESEMVFDGLVESDQNVWQHTADLYVWGTYTVTNLARSPSVRKPEYAMEIELHLWDGVTQPTMIKETLACSFSGDVSAGELEASLARLVDQVISHAGKHDVQSDSAAIRKNIAQSLVETYDRMTLSYHHREELGLNNPEAFLQAAHMLETACFFDPDNANARVLYITCRWGWWMDFGFTVKNEFWSKWRRSEAWGKYANRFGLKPVTEELPFPYEQNGISDVYVQSLAEVLEMFPQWRSTEEMALEDEWQRQGVATDLMEAERHGFPTEMPHALAMKWKKDAEAELVRRKQMVADYAALNVANTNQPVSPKKPVVHSVLKSQPVAPAQNPWRLVPAPQWTRDFQTFFSLFRLFPPNALPLKIQATAREIQFPKQFEVRTVNQMGFFGDQLLILAMDERSAPSSDNNSDLSAELLDKHKRLWQLKVGEETPALFEADQFPQSIAAFLLRDNDLWVAGKTTGHLNLQTHQFRKYELTDGLNINESANLCFAGEHIYVADNNFRVSMLDTAQNHWSDLILPPANLSGGTGTHILLTGNERWLIYGAGSVLARNLADNTWTNLSKAVHFSEDTLPDNSGFWFGGYDGLRFYDLITQSLKEWTAPVTFNGTFISMMGGGGFGNSEIQRATLDRMGEQVRSQLQKLQAERKKNHETKSGAKTPQDPLHLDWRMPGEVTALANDGDYLWFGVANYFGNYLLLLHKPSGSLVGYYPMQPRDKIASIAVSKNSVWVGTAYGDHKLLQFAKSDFLSVPQSQWMNLKISVPERERLIQGMSLRDQAMYSFYAGDDAHVTELLGSTSPENANLEELFLLAFSNDVIGTDRIEPARFWFNQIISRYPDSPWAEVAQTALVENEQKHKVKAHQADLLAKYDLNHDGILDGAEKQRMEKDPAFQTEETGWNDGQLGQQIKEIMLRFDRDTNGKLDRDELESVRAQVTLFSQAAPEMLAGRKIIVAPLMTKSFPTVSAILKNYDANHDNALEPDELKRLAQDIQKQR